MKYNVGDRVRIKDYTQMREEFGYIEEDELIPTPYEPFCDDMQHWCGRIVTIKGMTFKGIHEGIPYYTMTEDSENIYEFTEDMFEPVIKANKTSTYKTNRDFYLSLGEFGRINYITNFIRFQAPKDWDLEVPLYQRKVKETFQTYLDLPYISDEMIEAVVQGSKIE